MGFKAQLRNKTAVILVEVAKSTKTGNMPSLEEHKVSIDLVFISKALSTVALCSRCV